DISKSSRLDAELSRENMSIVDLHPLLEGMTSYYNVKLNLPNMPIMVRALETRMGQVFDNLIANAKSFSDDVTVAAEKQGSDWHITVSDKGPGIPDNKLDAIFTRFYTERPAGEDFGQHSGLGLA